MTEALKKHWDTWGAKMLFSFACILILGGAKLYSNAVNDARYWKIKDHETFDETLRGEIAGINQKITEVKTEIEGQRQETREDLKEIQTDIKTLLRRP